MLPKAPSKNLENPRASSCSLEQCYGCQMFLDSDSPLPCIGFRIRKLCSSRPSLDNFWVSYILSSKPYPRSLSFLSKRIYSRKLGFPVAKELSIGRLFESGSWNSIGKESCIRRRLVPGPRPRHIALAPTRVAVGRDGDNGSIVEVCIHSKGVAEQKRFLKLYVDWECE